MINNTTFAYDDFSDKFMLFMLERNNPRLTLDDFFKFVNEKQTYFPIKSVEEYASNIKNNFFVFFNWLRYFSSRFNYDFHNQSTDVIYIINTEENKPFLIIILNEYYELNDETKLNEVIKIILKERRMISTFVPKKILDALNKVCKKDVKFK